MKFSRSVVACVGAAFLFFGISSAAIAEESSDTILLIDGNLPNVTSEEPVRLSFDLLAKMAPTTFSTTTIWTEGEVEFTGVAISELLNEFGVENGLVKATAINDYSIEFPVGEALVDQGIIAYLMNGNPMSIRDKGPLWIVYPFDSDEKYQSETYYSRSIWQLDRITISDD